MAEAMRSPLATVDVETGKRLRQWLKVWGLGNGRYMRALDRAGLLEIFRARAHPPAATRSGGSRAVVRVSTLQRRTSEIGAAQPGRPCVTASGPNYLLMHGCRSGADWRGGIPAPVIELPDCRKPHGCRLRLLNLGQHKSTVLAS